MHASSLSLRGVLSLAAAGSMIVACSGAGSGSGFEASSRGDTSDGGGGGGGSSGGASGSNPGSFSDDGGAGGGQGDGTTSGPVDTTPSCDTGLALDDGDAASFAKAIGICTTATGQGFGLVSATYSKAFGSSEPPHAGQWGLLPKFGSVIKPREGATLGALSTGYAREYDNPQGTHVTSPASSCDWSGLPGSCPVGNASDFVNSSPTGPLQGTQYPTAIAPPGFPQSGSSCPQGDSVNDMIDVKLVLKAPADATGFRFDFDFYSSEWPNFVCSTFNDAFVAYLTSADKTDNISFDSNKNPIAINNNFLNRCTPGAPLGCNRTDGNVPDAPVSTSTCTGGAGELDGTGYATLARTLCGSGADVSATLGGATGWLSTEAAIKPGEQFTLELMIWDAGDGILDSTVLIDHFQWIGGTPANPGTQRPPK